MMATDLKPSAQRVLAFLMEHGSITTQQASRELGMTELRSRISEIVRAGFPIRKEWENSKNKFGEKVVFIRYSLAKGDADNGDE